MVTIKPLIDVLGYQVLDDKRVVEEIYVCPDGQIGTLYICRTSMAYSCAGMRKVTRQIGRVTAECAQQVLLEQVETDAWILNSFKR